MPMNTTVNRCIKTMSENQLEYARQAHKLLDERNYVSAGDYYTFASYASLGKSEFSAGPYIGAGVSYLLKAALCYHLDEQPERSINRCRQGILIAQDLRNVWSDEIHIGLTHEYEGDFQVIGDIAGSEDSYSHARNCYKKCTDTTQAISWLGEAEFENPIVTVLQFAESADYPVDDETATAIRVSDLMERIDFKLKHFPSIIQAVLEDGHFDY